MLDLVYLIIFCINLCGMLIITLVIAALTLIERKFLALNQRRVGPYYVGYRGRLQYIADALKLFIKGVVIYDESNKFWFVAVPSICGLICYFFWVNSVWCPSVSIVDIEYNLVYATLLSISFSFCIILLGYFSGNKYTRLASIRSSLMVINLELFLGLMILTTVVVTESFCFSVFVEYQKFWWLIFTYFGLAGLLCLLFLLEVGRTPFDLAEAESELVTGYSTEIGGFTFGIFYLGEYFHLFFFSSVMSIIFLGGWECPNFLNLHYLTFFEIMDSIILPNFLTFCFWLADIESNINIEFIIDFFFDSFVLNEGKIVPDYVSICYYKFFNISYPADSLFITFVDISIFFDKFMSYCSGCLTYIFSISLFFILVIYNFIIDFIMGYIYDYKNYLTKFVESITDSNYTPYFVIEFIFTVTYNMYDLLYTYEVCVLSLYLYFEKISGLIFMWLSFSILYIYYICLTVENLTIMFINNVGIIDMYVLILVICECIVIDLSRIIIHMFYTFISGGLNPMDLCDEYFWVIITFFEFAIDPLINLSLELSYLLDNLLIFVVDYFYNLYFIDNFINQFFIFLWNFNDFIAMLFYDVFLELFANVMDTAGDQAKNCIFAMAYTFDIIIENNIKDAIIILIYEFFYALHNIIEMLTIQIENFLFEVLFALHIIIYDIAAALIDMLLDIFVDFILMWERQIENFLFSLSFIYDLVIGDIIAVSDHIVVSDLIDTLLDIFLDELILYFLFDISFIYEMISNDTITLFYIFLDKFTHVMEIFNRQIENLLFDVSFIQLIIINNDTIDEFLDKFLDMLSNVIVLLNIQISDFLFNISFQIEIIIYDINIILIDIFLDMLINAIMMLDDQIENFLTYIHFI